MRKQHLVRLADEERRNCDDTIATLTGSSQKARWARILRPVGVVGTGWSDPLVAAAFRCRVRTV